MKIRSPIEERKARIEIIPLIDIMFFLLACFMIVSLKMIQMRGVKVDLPGAAVSQPVKKSDFISLSIDAQGTIYYQKEQKDQPTVVDKDQLQALLKAAMAEKNDEPPRVYIRADKDSLHGEVMEVLDRAKVAGITKVAFEIKNEKVTAPNPGAAAPAPPAAPGAAAPAAPAVPAAPAAPAPPAPAQP